MRIDKAWGSQPAGRARPAQARELQGEPLPNLRGHSWGRALQPSLLHVATGLLLLILGGRFVLSTKMPFSH